MSQPFRILSALMGGLLAGIALGALLPHSVGLATAIAQPVGSAWLHGLQMTVVPLVVALLVTGVAATAEAATAGRVAVRAITLIIATVFVTGSIAALVTPLLLDLFPVPVDAARSLRAALAGVGPAVTPPPLAEFFASIVPTNVLAAASGDQFLSLIIFTLAFAFAVTRLDPGPRALLVGVFDAIQRAMLVVIGWVLWLAPLGVFALAFIVGAKAGAAAFGALLHYILIVSTIGLIVILLAYPLAMLLGGVPLGRFARALLPAQAVAISTQSSLASLPAMLEGANALGIARPASGMALPLAVAMFRATQPAMNVAISIYIARWFGIAIVPGNLAAAVAVGALVSLGSVSLPAQITLFASVAPICNALGVPIAPIGLFIAVETIPDIFRTLGNVSMDLAMTTAATRGSSELGDPARSAPA